jgi:hypothetical protein
LFNRQERQERKDQQNRYRQERFECGEEIQSKILRVLGALGGEK